jgi:hypothetical protein
VDELWDSMCHTAINLISNALNDVDNAEMLLKIKGVVALFIQTMDGWGYSVSLLDNFLLTLFEKYAELLKRRFSEDFQEIVSTDDYMPMPIANIDEYDKVVNVSWFTPDKPREELVYVSQTLDRHLLTVAASLAFSLSLKCTLSVVSISGISSINFTFSATTTFGIPQLSTPP